MKLDELHVRDRCPRTPCERDTIASRGIGIGGVQVNLAAATRCQNNSVGAHDLYLASFALKHIGTEHPIVGHRTEFRGGDEINDKMVFQNRQVRRFARRFHQGPCDFTTSRVLRMQDPSMRVPALATQKVMMILTIETNPVIDQISYRLTTVRHNLTHHALTAQTRPSFKRVGDMHFHRVTLIALGFGKHRGDAALRPRGVGFKNISLGQHHHRPVTRRPQSKGKSGNPRADDHEIRIHHRHHEPDRPCIQTKFSAHAT
ncbi:MAG: hypothetical protein RLY69_244 [Verrucomicrobiota bacterium]